MAQILQINPRIRIAYRRPQRHASAMPGGRFLQRSSARKEFVVMQTAKSCLGFLAASVVSACLVPPAAATPVDSSGTIVFSERADSGPSAGGPVFDAAGVLLSAGAGHPTMGAVIGPQQGFGPGNLFSPPQPFPALAGTADPAAIGTAGVFDFATIGMTAYNLGASPAFLARLSPLSAGASEVAGFGTVEAALNLSVRNDTGSGLAGYIVAGLGFVFEIPHSQAGYVATALFVSVNGLDLPPIVLATDGNGPLEDVATGGLLASLFFLDHDVGRDVDRFFAYGFSATPLLGIAAGDSWAVEAMFSAIVDPGGSFFDVFVELPLPEFDEPVLGRIRTGIPEPATAPLLCGLLAGMLLLRRAAARRAGPGARS